jgi:hypothetical protein
MKTMRLTALLLPALCVLAAPAARAQIKEPRICPTTVSTVAFDLGAYRGAYLVTYADGSALGAAGWQSCGAQPKGPERPWESCNFSICDAPDGGYQLRFADTPAPPVFTFKLAHGMVDLAASKAGQQVGNFGVDATGSRKQVAFDLQGYALAWSLAHWPGPFLGGETHGRAVHDGGKLIFSLFAGGPYRLNFGGAHAQLSVAESGAVTVAPAEGPLAVHGNAAWLRVAPVDITPPGSGEWSIGGVAFAGPQTLMVPAGAKLPLTQGGATVQTLTMDSGCHPGIEAGVFKVALSAKAHLAGSCN